jgi:putative flavoprotein involved in K+ transport
MNTPLGRKARPSVISHGAPLIRVRPETLKAAGVERVAKTVGVKDGLPLLEDGRVLPVSNVIWCNGYHPGFSWIDLPVLETNGRPRQERGVVADVPGLYFVGLHFLYAMSSGMIHGVGRDADHVAEQIAVRRGEGVVNELQPKAPIRKAG